MNVYKYNKFLMDLFGFRSERVQLFLDIFKPDGCSLLDVGGGNYFWDMVATRYDKTINITILNLLTDGFGYNNNINYIQANALTLPFKDQSYDIVFSNSLLDHLRTFDNQKKVANEIRRVGKRYFVQTINRNFLIEPHYWTPLIHFLPKRFQKKLIRNFTLWGIMNRPDNELINNLVDEIIPSTEKEFKELFPEAHIIHEKWCGLTKSFMAVKL